MVVGGRIYDYYKQTGVVAKFEIVQWYLHSIKTD
jgi:hypothetical protein